MENHTKAPPITTLQIGDRRLEVSTLSPETQRLIKVLESWRQHELDLTNELMMVQSALRDLQREITNTIQVEPTDDQEKDVEHVELPTQSE
jgi:hypothetical protein